MDAVIFDMDGTLIDSEPMWKAAEKHVFSSVGVEVSEALAAQTAVMTTRQVTEFWYRNFPWSDKTLAEVESAVVDRVATLIAEQGKPMEGVKDVLDFFQKKHFRIGLATNAPASLIPVVLEKLGISDYFHATSSSEYELKGKPDPAVYFTTAKKLNVEPEKCIAVEDSISGVLAASRANMKTIVVPPLTEFDSDKYAVSHLKIRRLSEFSDVHLAQMMSTV